MQSAFARSTSTGASAKRLLDDSVDYGGQGHRLHLLVGSPHLPVRIGSVFSGNRKAADPFGCRGLEFAGFLSQTGGPQALAPPLAALRESLDGW